MGKRACLAAGAGGEGADLTEVQRNGDCNEKKHKILPFSQHALSQSYHWGDPLAPTLTQSGERRGGAPLLAEGHKLLREHGVAALGHGAGPESGALWSHHAGAR